jgi:ATP-dependent Clp protease ATP-binding subunit ClpB
VCCNIQRLEAAQLNAEDRQGEQGEAHKPKLLHTQGGAEEIAEVVSRATGIPVSKMMQGERGKLLPQWFQIYFWRNPIDLCF